VIRWLRSLLEPQEPNDKQPDPHRDPQVQVQITRSRVLLDRNQVLMNELAAVERQLARRRT
jgi:hypothetical protein